MRGILYRYRIPPQDAEDLVQTALLAMIAKRDEIKTPNTWLCGTLENCCRAFLRERRQYAARFLELDGMELDPATEGQWPLHDLRIDLDRLLLLLPAGHRQLVVLRFRLGFAAAEAARATGFAGSSGRQTLRRSLARLRAAIGGETAPVESPRSPRVSGRRLQTGTRGATVGEQVTTPETAVGPMARRADGVVRSEVPEGERVEIAPRPRPASHQTAAPA